MHTLFPDTLDIHTTELFAAEGPCCIEQLQKVVLEVVEEEGVLNTMYLSRSLFVGKLNFKTAQSCPRISTGWSTMRPTCGARGAATPN